METLLRDVRYAFLVMRRNKGFAAAAIATLALGIGATTAVFSIIYGVLLRPLPYPDSDRLVRLSEEHPGGNSPLRQPMLSNLTYYAWSQTPRTVAQLAGYATREFIVELPGGTARVTGSAGTASLFALVGQTPALGRFFRADEEREGANQVIVLSDRGWRERFAGDPAVVGRGVTMDGKPYTIIGVTQPGFYFPDRETMLWTPLDVPAPAPDQVEGKPGRMTVITALARLTPGATTAQAEAEGTAAARSTPRPMSANLLFGAGGPPVARVRLLVDEMTARVRSALLVLAAAVLCVLSIACANVANLFLSRGVARQRELTVRAAIGAGRAALIRQLLTESVVLSAIGGALGLALAAALLKIAPAVAVRNFPRLDDVAIDWHVVVFLAVLSLVTAIASGLMPALRAARIELAESLHGGDGASAGGFRGRHAGRLRAGLLVVEATFAVLLVVAASLLARSFMRLTQVDAGYTADRVVVAEVFIPGADDSQRVLAIATSTLERIRATAGVVAAGATNIMPLDQNTLIAGFPAPWTPGDQAPAPARAIVYTSTPGYAEAIGLRLKRGRFFTDADLSGNFYPWVVNEEFARLYLPSNPVDYRWTQAATATTPARINVIIGVVGNVLKNGNDAKTQAEVYFTPRAPSRFINRFEIVVRTAGDPASMAPAVRAIVREAAPTAAVETVALSDRVAASFDQPRFAMMVLLSFTALALALASVGLYGVLSYGVSQRRRELGVRAALGASRRALVQLVVVEGLASAGLGLVIGLGAAAMLTRLMQSVLFGVAPLDPVSFAIAPAVLIPVAIAASLLPASRAASVDPAQALRDE